MAISKAKIVFYYKDKKKKELWFNGSKAVGIGKGNVQNV
jgi:hypothetical protein